MLDIRIPVNINLCFHPVLKEEYFVFKNARAALFGTTRGYQDIILFVLGKVWLILIISSLSFGALVVNIVHLLIITMISILVCINHRISGGFPLSYPSVTRI